MSVVKYATSFRLKRFPAFEVLTCVDYVRVQYILRAHNGIANVVKIAPHLPVDGVFMETRC